MAAPQRPGATSTIRGHGKPHLAVSDGPRGRDSILSPFDRRLLRTRKLPDVVSPLKEIQLSVPGLTLALTITVWRASKVSVVRRC